MRWIRLFENVDIARKVMEEAGLDYDELVATPESEWDELPEHHREFMKIRKEIGPNNDLLGVYARIMCDPRQDNLGRMIPALAHDESDEDVAFNMTWAHTLLTELKDRLSELTDNTGRKKTPLQFTRTMDLIGRLEHLTLRDYPSVEEPIRDMMREMPKRVWDEAWRKIYRDYKFQPPYDKIEDDICEMLYEIAVPSDGDEEGFKSRMEELAGMDRPLTPEDFIQAIREISGMPIGNGIYPHTIGLFDHDSFNELEDAVAHLADAGIGCILIHRSEDKYKENVPEGHVLVVLPLADGEIDSVTLYDPAWSHHMTGFLFLGDGTRFRVVQTIVPLAKLEDFIEEVKPRIVGPWQPLLKERMDELRIKSIDSMDQPTRDEYEDMLNAAIDSNDKAMATALQKKWGDMFYKESASYTMRHLRRFR